MLENLKKLRDETGTTQKQLADAVSVSQQSINKYENHNVEPDIATLVRIADYFNTSVDYLIGNGGAPGAAHLALTPDEVRLVAGYKALSPRQRQSIRMVMENYLNPTQD